MYPRITHTLLITAAGLASLGLAGAGAACAANLPAAHAPPPHPVTAHDTGVGGHPGTPVSPASPLGSHGELAFVAHQKLFLLGGPAGAQRRAVLPGVPGTLAWSVDHRWLAAEVSPGPSKPTALWLVNAAGTHTKRLTPRSWDIAGFAWSPHARRIAVIARLPHRSVLATLGLAGDRKILATVSNPGGLAWSPGGRQLAVAVNSMSRPGVWQGKLDVVNARGGRPRVVLAGKGNAALWLAAWWPDGSGLLYWVDPAGSASIAADGLGLYTVSLATHRPRNLVPSMLVHRSWLAFSPDHHKVAVVSGGGREIWRGDKHVVICRASGACTPVAKPGGVVDLQASWSATGKALVFMRASASGPFGPHGQAGFTPSWIRRWHATSRLWIATANGSGTHRLTAPLGTITSGGTYYGYVPYPESIAWTRAPLATAG